LERRNRQVVDHKLGERAGLAAAEGLHTVGNVLEGAYAFAMMGPRAVAKRGLAASLKQTADGGSSSAPAQRSRPTESSSPRWMLRDLNDVPVLQPQFAVVEASDEPRPSVEPL
jgi:hypothetical protein